MRQMLKVLVRRAGYDASFASNVTEAKRTIESTNPFEAILTDLLMPDGTGIEVLTAAKQRDNRTQVVLFTAHATTERAVEAMRDGAYDYLEKPVKNAALLATLEKAVEKHALLSENATLRSKLKGSEIVGESQAMLGLKSLIDRAAQSVSNVLVTGESGTGKELVARALHQQSPRAQAPFVVINCGALPDNLIESELFGHEKGAFTGAASKKEGLFRAAEGGTMFLDEVGELALDLQVKLLRVLQERKVRSIGGSEEVPVDVRVIAATNRELEAEVEAGNFREDLFYRLDVIRLEVPALRERPSDIPRLAEHLLEKHATREGRNVRLSEDAIEWLRRQPFPGNVRELENTMERAVALSMGPEIGVDALTRRRAPVEQEARGLPEVTEGFDVDAYLGKVEYAILKEALKKSGGVRKHAARFLGMSFRSFRYRLAKYEDVD